MSGKAALLGGTVVGAVLAFGLEAANAKTAKHAHVPRPSPAEVKVDALTASLKAVEARLDEETRARQALETQVAAATDAADASRADAQAARAELADQIKTLPPSPAAPAASAEDAASSSRKGITITPGGFLAAESIYRSKNDAADISSSFSRIPFDNAALAHTNELRGTARQTRLSLLVQGDVDPTTHAAFYGEFDFQAAAQTANSNESNSYNPRIRHLYGTLDWDRLGLHLLAGQTWSLATLNSKGITPRNEAPPPLIDGQYMPGFVWARQPQLRLVKDWNKSVWAAVSLENPQTTFAAPATGISSTAAGISLLETTPGISGFDSANSLSLNHLPDVVGKLAYEPVIGGARPLHLEVFGLWRTYSVRIDAASGNAAGLPAGSFNTNAQGGGVGGSVAATVLPHRLDLQASVITGQGIGRYGSAQLPDVTLKPDGHIAPIQETMFLVGGTWHALATTDIYVFGGEERQQAKYFDLGSGVFGFGNPAASFTAASCTTEGGVCSPNLRQASQITGGIWHRAYSGAFGQIRIGLQYSHTNLTGFPGVGGYAPKTSDNMVFTSFRYYLPTPN